MTNKVELNTLTQVVHKEQAFLTALNENFLRLQQAINDTISRSGVVPNQMEEVLDMNGKAIINVRSVEPLDDGSPNPDDFAVTRRDIKDLIAEVEAAAERLKTLVEQAKEALALYASEYILPPAIAARDDAIEAKNAAKGYYDDTKALYDQLASLVANLDTLLAVGSDLVNIDAVAGDLTNIDSLAAISSAITTCADNIAAILAAPTYAEHAETWAEGSDADVAVLGGTHSAKGWAQLVAQGYVPVTRTINGKALSDNITLTASDVGAATAAQGAKADTALQNTATGTNSLTVGGVASASAQTGSTNIGIGSKITGGINSTVIGDNTISSVNGGIALGHNAKVSGGNRPIALGSLAEANAASAIMIGGGRNNETKTLKVALHDQPTVATTEAQGLYTLLLSDGTIPAGRLPNAITSTQVTIATTDWSSNTCTKSVTGVTATSDVFVAPAPVLANVKAYSAANVFCSAVGAGTVTFTCETTPTDTLTVNIGVN